MGKKSLEVLLVKLYSIVDRDFMGEKEAFLFYVSGRIHIYEVMQEIRRRKYVSL